MTILVSQAGSDQVGVLDGVFGLAGRAQQPVGEPEQVRTLRLELPGEVGHKPRLPRSTRQVSVRGPKAPASRSQPGTSERTSPTILR